MNAATLYRALGPAVLGYLRTQRVADPEDVLGEVFLSVARDAGKFRGDEAAARRWVFSIAHNRVIDAVRRRDKEDRRVAAVSAASAAAVAPTHDDPVDPALVAALWSLPPDQREVVVLRFVADLGLADVARITRRSEGAVKSLQHRGLENLRNILVAPVSHGA